MDNKYFKLVDITKFFFSLCIIAIHTGAFTEVLSEVNYWYLEKVIFRLAVPFFFIVSGYFIGNKIYSNFLNIKKTIRNFVKSLTIPLIIFQVINLILNGVLQFLDGSSNLRIALLSIRSVIFYPYGALWYIQASIVGIIFLYYFIKKK